MIKCNFCKYLIQNGKKYTCAKNKNKIIYGNLNEPFKEYCTDIEITDKEKKRRKEKEKKKSAVIIDYTERDLVINTFKAALRRGKEEQNERY